MQKISTDLADAIRHADATSSFNVVFDTPYENDARIDSRLLKKALEEPCFNLDRREMIAKFKERALRRLGKFKVQLVRLGIQDDVKILAGFWLNDSVYARATRSAIEKISSSLEVLFISESEKADVPECAKGEFRADSEDAATSKTNGDFASWNVKMGQAPRLWARGILGEGALVALVDSGVRCDHPDLKNRMWRSSDGQIANGMSFIQGENDPCARDSHGTLSAGLIVGDGTGWNGKKIATGVAPGATLMALRIDREEVHAWSAFEFAIEHGADVICLTWSWKANTFPDYERWRVASERIAMLRVLLACSIGKLGDRACAGGRLNIPYNIPAPANCPPPWLHPLQTLRGGKSAAVACGAVTSSKDIMAQSSEGPAEWASGRFSDYPYNRGQQQGLIKPDICAPGPETISCSAHFDDGRNRLYSKHGSTSASTPHVAGCMALLVGACKAVEAPVMPGRIQEALEMTADRIGGQTDQKQNTYGSGIVDVAAAYEYGLCRNWW